MNKIKDCPFCGSDNVDVGFSGDHFVYCMDCDAQGPEATNQEKAIAAWNHRSQDEVEE